MSTDVNILVVSSSLHPASRSRMLARRAHDHLERSGESPRWLDAADLSLPLCDGHAAHESAGAQTVTAAIEDADGILLAMGIYNFNASAAAKTFVELGGSAWRDKVVAFACAAGGAGSYMATMGLANSLMLDFRSVIVPRFVYADGSAFAENGIVDPEVERRVVDLTSDLARMTRALRGALSLES